MNHLEVKKEDLAAIYAELEAKGVPRLGPGATAEYLDEDNPYGLVVLRDAQGAPRLIMPSDVFEDLKNYKP